MEGGWRRDAWARRGDSRPCVVAGGRVTTVPHVVTAAAAGSETNAGGSAARRSIPERGRANL